MKRLSLRLWHLCLLGLFLTPLLHISGPSAALAQSDDVIGEDEEDLEVEEEEDEETVSVPDTPADAGGDDQEEEGAVMQDEEEEEEEEIEEIGVHPDAETTHIFVGKQNTDFLAGEKVHTVIGFTNKGQSEVDLIITAIDGSFRYPQDFSYTIQNFSYIHYETYVKPETEVTFDYFFSPSESFYARSFGLQINVMYQDPEGVTYRTAVFNDTVNIVEVEEGFDGQTFFMYVFMVSGISLLMFIVHYVYTTVVRRPKSTVKRRVETGTQGKDDVDMQWIPEGSVPGSSKKSPRASPRKTRSNTKK